MRWVLVDAMIDFLDGVSRGPITRPRADMRGRPISRLEVATTKFRKSLRGYAGADVEQFRANAKRALGESEMGEVSVSMSAKPVFANTWFGYSRVDVDEFVGRVWATLGPAT